MDWFGLRRFVVTGNSMAPTYNAGDHLLVRHRRQPPEAGQVVVVADPRTGMAIVKRIHSTDDHGIDVRGDNPAESTDSRDFGSIPFDAVIGVVLRRYYQAG